MPLLVGWITYAYVTVRQMPEASGGLIPCPLMVTRSATAVKVHPRTLLTNQGHRMEARGMRRPDGSKLGHKKGKRKSEIRFYANSFKRVGLHSPEMSIRPNAWNLCSLRWVGGCHQLVKTWLSRILQYLCPRSESFLSAFKTIKPASRWNEALRWLGRCSEWVWDVAIKRKSPFFSPFCTGHYHSVVLSWSALQILPVPGRFTWISKKEDISCVGLAHVTHVRRLAFYP